jgi:hypothetical protein
MQPESLLSADMRTFLETTARAVLATCSVDPGRVWECIGWGGAANQNPGFAPSVTLPVGVLG